MMQPSGTPPPKEVDEASWWFKLLTRGVGVIGGIVAMILGIMRCVTFTPMCMVGGITEMCIGFMTVVLEAPCCCQFLDFVEKIGQFSETRPYWQKGALYTLTALLPILLCFSTTTILGSSLVFATGVLYGLMALGKKASRDEMMSKVRTDDVEMQKTLIGNEESVNLRVPDSPSK